jgi:hypothetical protein
MFQRNPEKLEAKALDYERRGKTAKAQKYREKAARLRGGNLPVSQTSTVGTTSTPYFTSFRTPQTYEQNALKWEQRGNWQKAQKNREKVWRLQNPQFPATYAAPNFYDSNNRFLGYNIGQQQGLMQGNTLNKGLVGQPATIHHVLPATVETHMHPTLVQQTTRPEKIVEVQPVVHREIDAPQVHVIERHSYEQVRSTGPSTITAQPIVEETIRPRVIEEIQPVVHREVPAPFVERVEQHVTEHITQPTTMTKDIINDGLRTQPMGIAAGAPIGQQGFQQGGIGQPGFQQGGLGQPGFQQGGIAQPGFQQGGLQQGLGQQGLAGQNLQSGIRPGQQPLNTQPGLNNNLRR